MRAKRIQKLETPGILPVIRLNSVEGLRGLFASFFAGGITSIELTMTMPDEVFHSHESGADFVKIFPMSPASPGYLRDLLGPMPFLKLFPSGGITLEKIPQIFSNGARGCCVGGELVRKDLIAKQDWKTLSKIAETFTAKAFEAKI